jgi:hypothetical protein
MLLSTSLAWLGIGLLVLANPERARRALGLGPSPILAWLLRCAGAGLLAVSGSPIAPEAGGALTVVSALLVAMALASISVLVVPLRPRYYALTLPLCAVVAAFSWASG